MRGVLMVELKFNCEYLFLVNGDQYSERIKPEKALRRQIAHRPGLNNKNR